MESESDDENDFDSVMAAAENFRNEGSHTAEGELYTRLIGLFPDRFEPYFKRALVRRTMGQRADALEDASKAISLNQNESACHFFRGLWRLEAGLFQESLDDLEKAAALDTAAGSSYYEVSARFLRVLALTALAKFDDANREIQPLAAKAAFAVNGRRWTIQQLQECILKRSRPQL